MGRVRLKGDEESDIKRKARGSSSDQLIYQESDQVKLLKLTQDQLDVYLFIKRRNQESDILSPK